MSGNNAKPFNDSATTLQMKHNQHFTFNLQNRFPKIRVQGKTGYKEALSSFTGKGTSLGYGTKTELAKVYKKYRDHPTCADYKFKDISPKVSVKFTKSSKKSKSIETPGVGTYEVQKKLGIGRPKYSMRGREDYSPTNDTPSPVQYKPQKVGSMRYTKISFGIGDRNLFPQAVGTPGPGTYRIKSPFDKYQLKIIK